jgi:thymidylate kinase
VDEQAARALLAELGRRMGDRVLLWRGEELGGSDIDLLVRPAAAGELAVTLREAGFRPSAGDPGQVVWRGRDGVVVDVLSAAAWPGLYPELRGVFERSGPDEHGIPVASDEDRLLMLAAEAVAGRPLAKVARKAGALVSRPGARERLESLAGAQRARPLARLVADPERLAARASRGRLPYPPAVAAALRSPCARAALAARVRARARRLARPGPRGLLVTLSGMDGSGKSSAAAVARERLEEAGLLVEVAWVRLAQERELRWIGTPFKWLLRPTGRIADPVAAAAPGTAALAAAAAERASSRPRRRGPVGWCWTLVVAAVSGRSHRRAARGRRAGRTVVCDRGPVDSVVDLELRYGRHRLGEAVLTLVTPRPDLAIWLDVDARLAAERKPGDQDEGVLRRMEALYAERAGRAGLVHVDGRSGREQVRAEVERLLDELLATAPTRRAGRGPRAYAAGS